MAGPKRWTTAAAADRASRRQDGPSASVPGTRRRTASVWACKLSLIFAVAAAVAAMSIQPAVSWPFTLAAGAVVTAASAAYMVLARKVGPLTAIPAVAVACAVVVAALVTIPGSCPGAALPSGLPAPRCTAADTASLALVAMMSVVLVALVTRLPYRTARWLLLAARRAIAAVRD